jgi:hypothetical protein
VENYLFDNEQYFVGMDVPEDRKVFFASGLLEGATKTWWRHPYHVAQEAGTLDTLFVWDTFRTMLKGCFRAVNASHHARDKFACLKQDGSVRYYAQKMQELSLQIPGMSDEELLTALLGA